MRATQQLHDAGQSLWLDNITRGLLTSGGLKRYIDEFSVTGLTSNPTIFDHAVKNSNDYDAAIREKTAAGKTDEALFFELALEDVSAAADLFRPIHEATNRVDGWASLEVSPRLAYDTASTVATAKELHARAGRPNVFIKIPGNEEGIPAIEEAIFAGVPINVTLLFSREQYLASAQAYVRGIERRVAAGLNAYVPSVASLFVSRWDVAVAGKVPGAAHDQLGIAMAKRTYKAYRDLLASDRWLRLLNVGARSQRLLWASTGTKDPKASDVLYVKSLAAPHTVNTMPDKTLLALADHGDIGAMLAHDGGNAEEVLERFTQAGIDLDALAADLQREGAGAFVKSWDELLACIAEKSDTLRKSASRSSVGTRAQRPAGTRAALVIGEVRKNPSDHLSRVATSGPEEHAEPAAKLQAALARLGPSDHLCISYRTWEDQLAASVPFIQHGLKRHEQCVYIADDASTGDVARALEAAGIALDSEQSRGALSVLTKRDVYLVDGRFDPDRMLAWFEERADAAVRGGFTALRVFGEMRWLWGLSPGVERLVEYEARLNRVLRERPISALCGYDRTVFQTDVIRQLIVAHPSVVVDQMVCGNPYYVPPSEQLAQDWPEREVAWMLANLSHLQRAENELRESEKRFRALSHRLLAVQEMERRAIARELHDDLGQILTALKLSLKRTTPPGSWQRRERLAANLAIIDEAIEHTRRLALDLRPPLLDDRGLTAALQWYVSRHADHGAVDIRLDVDALDATRIPPALATACFRLVQEALTNVLRHADARHVCVTIRESGEALEVVVQDDGRGFDVDAATERAGAGVSLGLLGMKERVSLAGGTLTIESGPGHGTTIRGRFPLGEDSATPFRRTIT